MATTANVSSVMKEGADFAGSNAPAGDDPSGQFLGMVSELTAAEKSVPNKGAAALTYIRPDEYRFRTRPGYRNTAIKLRLAEHSDDDLQNQKNRDRWKKWAKRQGLEIKELEQWDVKVYDLIGSNYIEFRPVRGEMEATYVTKDATVAAYIRRRIAAGEFRDVIYEDVAPVEMEINGVKELFMPITDSARQAVAQARATGD